MEIKEFQDFMNELYALRDKQRGALKTFLWLVEEVGELSSELRKRESGIKDNDDSLAEEFADVFAWLCSLANIMNIDLESAALKKYRNKCPKCGNIPCTCTTI
ncbi:MAG: MazG nucleotide pyrophosphohydrolase domain-containing protein [Promethearchaeota archaeon]